MKWALLALLALHIFIAVKNGIRLGFRAYIVWLLIAVDQFYNALLGGYPDETISSRCGRGQDKWYWRLLGRILDTIDKDHCMAAIRGEARHMHQPEELR